ncbi:hypothetical protein J6590_085440 [Homalodisca vitripennis]|nr:hypothetical protein J6590_085440 [Homalodisca vitripennis]
MAQCSGYGGYLKITGSSYVERGCCLDGSQAGRLLVVVRKLPLSRWPPGCFRRIISSSFDYMSSATYNGWRTPTKGSSKSLQHRLLETFSSLCPDCLKDDGVNEVTEIPILKDAIDYTYFHIINPIIKVLVHNFGIDKEVIYTSTVSVCDRNERDMDTMELGDVLQMICSDIKRTVEKGHL